RVFAGTTATTSIIGNITTGPTGTVTIDGAADASAESDYLPNGGEFSNANSAQIIARVGSLTQLSSTTITAGSVVLRAAGLGGTASTGNIGTSGQAITVSADSINAATLVIPGQTSPSGSIFVTNVKSTGGSFAASVNSTTTATVNGTISLTNNSG